MRKAFSHSAFLLNETHTVDHMGEAGDPELRWKATESFIPGHVYMLEELLTRQALTHASQRCRLFLPNSESLL